MPFFREISMPGCRGGIWKITESWEDLCRMLPRATYHNAYVLEHFKSEKRRLEYAAVRMLLFTLLDEDREVLYHLSGRPYYAGNFQHLSISHTSGYAAVLLSFQHGTGIDIEACSPRVLRLKDRIVGRNEQAVTMYDVLLHWSAKETVFKLLDKDGIDFTEHLAVSGLSCPAGDDCPDSDGSFFLSYQLSDGSVGRFRICYLTSHDFVLTYTCEGASGL